MPAEQAGACGLPAAARLVQLRIDGKLTDATGHFTPPGRLWAEALSVYEVDFDGIDRRRSRERGWALLSEWFMVTSCERCSRSPCSCSSLWPVRVLAHPTAARPGR